MANHHHHYCFSCGKEIHFYASMKSKYGKYIPLSGKTGTRIHRCSARPFNKYTRREWWQRQQQIQKYFVLLGLSSLCSSVDEVKRAYRKLALLYHPDRSNNASTTGKFIEIQEAYEKCLQELQNRGGGA
jgi:hypothetical protein